MRDVFWVGSSLCDLKDFPAKVQDKIGYILQRVQEGGHHHRIQPLTGIRRGCRVSEIKSDYRGDTYRAVYLGNLGNLVYVLHCFQKKSKSGRKMPPREKELILTRLNRAQEHAQVGE